MQFKDLLRGTVLLVAIEATGLAAISAVAINSTGDDTLAALALGWWVVAIAVGIWLGRPVADGRGACAARWPRPRPSVQLPSESPARIALARLWPIALFAILAGAARAVRCRRSRRSRPASRSASRPPGATARRR